MNAYDPDERWGADIVIERDQWITLETPHTPVVGEEPEADRGYAFHRCMRVLDLFMQVMLIITKDERMRPISAHDFRPVMIIGAVPIGKPWRHVSDMLMFPNVPADATIGSDKPFTEIELNNALSAILTDRPYLTAMLWRTRAQRAFNQIGDAVDAVISFQVAAERLLWDTYKLILVDEGLRQTEMDTLLAADTPFKSLLTKIIPSRLGGTWDVTREDTSVAGYWNDLYLARNKIIHTGSHSADPEKAQAAFRLLRDYLEGCIVTKRTTYPRTALARLGTPGLERHGVLKGRFKKRVEAILQETSPFYWPWDRAGRQDPRLT